MSDMLIEKASKEVTYVVLEQFANYSVGDTFSTSLSYRAYMSKGRGSSFVCHIMNLNTSQKVTKLE